VVAQAWVVVMLQYGVNGLPAAGVPSWLTRKITPVLSGAGPVGWFWSWPLWFRSPICVQKAGGRVDQITPESAGSGKHRFRGSVAG
jgi:hypothetical protein